MINVKDAIKLKLHADADRNIYRKTISFGCVTGRVWSKVQNKVNNRLYDKVRKNVIYEVKDQISEKL